MKKSISIILAIVMLISTISASGIIAFANDDFSLMKNSFNTGKQSHEIMIDGEYIYQGTSNNFIAKYDQNGNMLASYSIPKTNLGSRKLVTGIGKKDNYIYACTRSGLPGLETDGTDQTLGDLFVFDTNLNLISQMDIKGKGARILIHNNIMIVAKQLYGFDIYDLSIPASPKLIYSHTPEKYEEFQGGAIYEHDNHLYYAAAQFGTGIRIYDITNVSKPTMVGFFSPSLFVGLKNNVHLYDLEVDYPHIYSTIASSVTKFGTDEDYRGVIALNVEDIIEKTASNKRNEIRFSITQIPDEYKSPKNNSTGDTDPTRMVKVGNRLITNTDNTRFAIFKIGDDNSVSFEKCLESEYIPYSIKLSGCRLYASSFTLSTPYIWQYNLIDLFDDVELNHKMVKTVDAIAPSCEKEGRTAAFECENCGYAIESEKIEKLDHNYKLVRKAVIPTCIDNGTTDLYVCSHCLDAKGGKVLDCYGHTPTQIITKATTKTDGTIVSQCQVCSEVLSSTIIYRPNIVELSADSYVYNGNSKKPTVTVKNSNGKVISPSNYTVTYLNNKSIGKATVKIVFKGNLTGTINKTFTIKPKSTKIASVTSLAKGFKINWKKQATQTTGYQIQYATNSEFSKGAKTVTVSKNSTVSKKITKLTAKKKYYVRVRTYKIVNGKKFYSSWSTTKTVTTKK